MATPGLALLLLLALLLGTAHGYSYGAPQSTCKDLMPHHPDSHGHHTHQQTTTYGGSVDFSKDEISPGETIQVTITLAHTIKGIHLQARDETGHRVGTWTIPDTWGHKLKLMKCSDDSSNEDSYVTHRDASVVSSSIQLNWTAPMASQLTGRMATVTVFGTYVVKKEEFWVMVPSSSRVLVVDGVLGCDTFRRIEDLCFNHITDLKYTKYAAELQCAFDKATLPIIKSQRENDVLVSYINSIIQSNVWLGVESGLWPDNTSTAAFNQWQGGSGECGFISLSNSRKKRFGDHGDFQIPAVPPQPPAVPEPGVASVSELGMASVSEPGVASVSELGHLEPKSIATGLESAPATSAWYRTECDSTEDDHMYMAVCVKRAEVQDKPTTAATTLVPVTKPTINKRSCPSNSYSYVAVSATTCYRTAMMPLGMENERSIDLMVMMCNNDDSGLLAKVTSKEENDGLYDLIKQNGDAYLALKGTGLQAASEFTWLQDGTSQEFSNWNDATDSYGQCAFMSATGNGLWYTKPCSQQLKVVCEVRETKPSSTTTSTTTTPTTTTTTTTTPTTIKLSTPFTTAPVTMPPTSPANPCQSHSCMGNEYCVPVGAGHKCGCPFQYGGDQCDKCLCKHNGTCSPTGCECPQTRTGALCQRCACMNSGECQPGLDYCVCHGCGSSRKYGTLCQFSHACLTEVNNLCGQKEYTDEETKKICGNCDLKYLRGNPCEKFVSERFPKICVKSMEKK